MQILNKLKTVFDGMLQHCYYSFLDGEKYIQVATSSNDSLENPSKFKAPRISPLGLGFKFRQGFLKDVTIINNIQVIETLIQYESVSNALITIKPSFWNKNIWRASVFIAGMKVYTAEIRFTDDNFYETQLLKWKFSIT